MPRKTTVHVAIATRHRPQGLARLLSGLQDLSIPEDIRLTLHVLDNSPEGSARDNLSRNPPNLPARLLLSHVAETGLSRVRNMALLAALEDGASHLGFIDDDEVPAPEWLEAHWSALARSGAAAGVGTVIPRYAKTPADWLRRGQFHAVTGPLDLAPAPFVTTGNIFFSLAPVRRANLRFDPAFDRTGGEDTAFFDAYAAAGGRIVFAANAVVVEDVPAERTRLLWLWRRWRRTGQTSARVRFRRIGPFGRKVACIGGGVLRITLGCGMASATLPLAVWGSPLWAKGLRIAARGVGFLDAAAGRFTADYGSAPTCERASDAATARPTRSRSTISCGR